MEIEIRRRETTGAGASARNESETLAKYEIMDGAPVRGENIPIRCGLHVVSMHLVWPARRKVNANRRCLWHALPFMACAAFHGMRSVLRIM